MLSSSEADTCNSSWPTVSHTCCPSWPLNLLPYSEAGQLTRKALDGCLISSYALELKSHLYSSSWPFEQPTATICALAPMLAHVAPLLGEHTQWLNARS
eukprot:1159807-Pelagomonas_calceolata.AAC.4